MMRYIDFFGQTLFIILGVWFLVHTWGTAGWPFQLLIVQLLLGPWQMVSCLAALFSTSTTIKQQCIHFGLVVAYFVILAAAMCLAPLTHNGYSDGIAAFYMVAIPWMLGIYYYRITWRLVFSDVKK